MAWGLPPSLPSRFLEAHPELMAVSSLQSRGGLRRGPLQAHSNSSQRETPQPHKRGRRLRPAALKRLLALPTQTASQLPL